EEVSIDTQTAPDGGELGWRVRGQLFVEEVETFVFDDAKVGDRSDAISTPFGFYIVEVEQRANDRKLDAAQRSTVADRFTTEWYDSLDGTLKIKNDFTDEDEARALKEVAP
ncbi:MAG: peptidylprolyl isomerase, partial [Dehalococcoidia bacterium]